MIKRHGSRDAISIRQPDEKRVFWEKNPEIKEMGGEEDKRMRSARIIKTQTSHSRILIALLILYNYAAIICT